MLSEFQRFDPNIPMCGYTYCYGYRFTNEGGGKQITALQLQPAMGICARVHTGTDIYLPIGVYALRFALEIYGVYRRYGKYLYQVNLTTLALSSDVTLLLERGSNVLTIVAASTQPVSIPAILQSYK